MFLTCVAIGCSVPADRREKWIADIKRGMESTEYNHLCSQHFISGEGPSPNKRRKDLQ
ncbi:hypothetical protein NL108_013577 [Boleophthalmus pectinirostris]|nr:hypothetical protein NL108_013577 [Boleophthalmus pectinirostris]